MPDAPPPEIPRPDDRLGEPVPAGELISGGVRAAWPWLLGGGIAVAVIGPVSYTHLTLPTKA